MRASTVTVRRALSTATPPDSWVGAARLAVPSNPAARAKPHRAARVMASSFSDRLDAYPPEFACPFFPPDAPPRRGLPVERPGQVAGGQVEPASVDHGTAIDHAGCFHGRVGPQVEFPVGHP